MTNPRYYLNLYTGTTWEEFLADGASVTGFRESRWPTVKQIQPGDILLCYLTGVSRFIGVLKATSEGYLDESPLWSFEAFPARVRVEPMITLTPETAVPIKSLRERLSWFQDMTSPTAWTGHVRGSPNRVDSEDAREIVSALREAEANPQRRPVDPKKLRRQPRTYMTRIGESDEEVTVPEDEEEVEDWTDEGESEPKSERVTHEEIQWLLLKLGNDMGLDLWVASNDRNKEYQGHRFADLPRMRDQIPRQFDEATMRTVELIDVIWLKTDTLVAAFEIEHTTAVYSGLLRMSDLIAMQPNLNLPLFLVAPDDRREKVVKEVNRPTFARMQPPLKQVCQYLPYSELRRFVERVGDFTRHLKPDFLDELAEVCELA